MNFVCRTIRNGYYINRRKIYTIQVKHQVKQLKSVNMESKAFLVFLLVAIFAICQIQIAVAVIDIYIILYIINRFKNQ